MTSKTRRISLTALVVLLALAVGGGVAGFASGSGVQTIHVLATPGKVVYLDFPPKGKSPGDLYVVSAALLDPNTHKVIGRVRGTQTHIETESGMETVQAMLTFELGSGNEIIIGGLSAYPLNQPPGLIKGKTVVRAILGGTGKYDGARGEEFSTRLRNGGYDHVFKLTY